MDTYSPVACAQPDDTPVERRVTILGATGSIGTSTIDVVKHEPELRVEAVASGGNAAQLARLAREVDARFAAIADPNAYEDLKAALSGSNVEPAAGREAVVEAARRPADLIMAAISGANGLAPTLAALDQGTTVALANKECLVCAGHLFMRTAAAAGATVLPVDSEHNAIFQALGAGRRADVKRIVLTASGGPFRTWTRDAMRDVTPAQALKHPNWSMGPKVTIDSATLMNKGLELIEAHHLFAMPACQIDVLVHPQSIIHGMVEFRDGSVVAQLGSPDMRTPIAHCLAWPARIDGRAAPLDLARIGTLSFEEPDLDRFPALALARAALQAAGGATTVLNAANEIAVAEFLNSRLGFAGIPVLVEATMEAAGRRGLTREPGSVDEALRVDHDSRLLARELLPEIAAKAL